MTDTFPMILWHNPACSTARKALEMIRAAGVEPELRLYLQTGWTADSLAALLSAAGLTARDALRRRIEERGTRDFPEAHGRKLYGELTMNITVDAAGRLLEADIVRGSGNALLDRRAVAIVQRAAPFARFDLELALLAFANHKVLQESVCCDARLEFGIRCRVGAFAHVSGRSDKLVQWN